MQQEKDDLALNLMLNLTPQMLSVMEPDGHLSWANQVALDYFGFSLSELRSDDFRTRILHPDDRKKLEEERQSALARGIPFESEQRIRGKDGEYRWFLVRNRPLKDADGRVVRWYGGATDIEDRMRAQEALRCSEREQLRLRHLTREFELSLEIRVAERVRIARELHDTLLQSFQALLLRLQTVSDLLSNKPSEAKRVLGGVIEQAASAIAEGREAVQGLRISAEGPNDLRAAISTLGKQLAADSGTNHAEFLRVNVEGAVRPFLPIVRDEIYRIAGEAMRNAFQHARGTKIEVELQYDKRQFWLCIRDDGEGIDAKVLANWGREGHHGLRGMRERAALIGGKLNIRSEPDRGTEVQFSIAASDAYTKAPAARNHNRNKPWTSE